MARGPSRGSSDYSCIAGSTLQRRKSESGKHGRLRAPQVSLVVDPPLVHANTEMRVRVRKGCVRKAVSFPNTFLRHESLYMDCLSSPERSSPSLNRALAGAHAGATLASGLRPDS